VDDVLDVRTRLGAIRIVLATIDDFDLVSFDGVLDTLQTLRRVVRRERSDEDRHLPTIRQELDDLLAERLTRFTVVGADVKEAVRLGCVRVEGEQLRLLGDLVEHADLRSEEHTSELQSRENLVCRLLLEKKKL